MKVIAIVDTETSGLDPKKDELLEFAVAFWSVEHCSLIDATSVLVHASSNNAEAVNRIPLDMARRWGADRAFVDNSVCPALASDVDAIVAHNADFDRQWLPELADKPWICTANDITWPSPSTSRSLTAIALAHGVGVVDAHRALADVMTIVRLFEAVHARGHSVRAMLEAGLRPKATFRALVSYDDREKAKAAGFYWDSKGRSWLRKMAIEDAGRLPFRTEQVEAA